MSFGLQEHANSYGAVPVEDSPRWNQRDQHWKNLVRSKEAVKLLARGS